MTTPSAANSLDKMHASLTGALNSWRAKYGLSVAASHAILTQYIEQEEKAERLKNQKMARKPHAARKNRSGTAKVQSTAKQKLTVAPIPTPKFQTHDDERLAQEREGRIRAAQDSPPPLDVFRRLP